MRRFVAKLARYAGVSAISTATSLVVLATLVGTGLCAAAWANVIATAAGTGPSFELNRRWVWGRTGRRSLRREVAPFCALSLAGLVLSTLAVAAATAWVNRSGYSTTVRTAAAVAANLAAFGSLWIAQFVVLDRLLFSPAATLRVVPADPASAPAPMRTAA